AARAKLREAIRRGRGRGAMRQIVRAQGGDVRAVDRPRELLPIAPVQLAVPSPKSGYVATQDALALGLASVALGAGRAKVTDVIDPSVGIVLAKKPGDRTTKGEPLAVVHARDEASARICIDAVKRAVTLAARPPRRTKLVLDILRS